MHMSLSYHAWDMHIESDQELVGLACETSEYSGTPVNGHPWIADTHDIITDNFEGPDCPSIDFNT